MRKSLTPTLITIGLLTLSAAAEEPAKTHTTTLTAGVAMTDGNSDTFQANGSLVTEGERVGLGSLRAGAEANYGESQTDGETETTVENAKAFGNVKKTITERTFGYMNLTTLYDDIAEIDYRVTAGPGLGLYLIKKEAASLSVESGAAYVWEKVADVSDDYVALRVAGRYDRKLSETSKVWQSVEYLPQIDDFASYLLAAELGVEAAVNATVSLRLVLQNKYDSEPGDDLEKNDTTLIGGLSVKI